MGYRSRRSVHCRARFALVLATAALAYPTASEAQRRDIDRQIQQRRQEVESIRRERDQLQATRDSLQRTARDINSELRIIERQRTATNRLINLLDEQASGIRSQLDTVTFELILHEDALAEKHAVMERRVTEIYKRGNLWAFEVLLAAESFGDLLSRYKYLFMVTRQDRALKEELEALRDRISSQRRDITTLQTAVENQRQERRAEAQEYVDLERDRQRTLNSVSQTERQIGTQLDSLQRAEAQLNDLLAALERDRLSNRASGVGTISEADMGQLDWPVDGTVVYQFGDQAFRDGTTITRDGIGIAVAVGTPVRSVRGGVVGQVLQNGASGGVVVIDQGAGFYTVYTQLSRIDVQRGQGVTSGQQIGLSGGENTREGPHIEFQIRQAVPNAATPIELNPLNWLRRR